jgi:hypothetical protein
MFNFSVTFSGNNKYRLYLDFRIVGARNLTLLRTSGDRSPALTTRLEGETESYITSPANFQQWSRPRINVVAFTGSRSEQRRQQPVVLRAQRDGRDLDTFHLLHWQQTGEY